MKKVAALGAGALIAGATFSVTAQSANACTRSSQSCTAHYTGLYFVSGSRVEAEIDYTSTTNNLNQKIFNDPYGDRDRIKAPLRDRNPGNGDDVYVRWDWYANGSYCYTNSIGVSAGVDSGGVTIGVGCTAGWHSLSSNRESKHISDSNWWFMTNSRSIDPEANSIRATVRACQDEAWVPDECGGSRLMGISY